MIKLGEVVIDKLTGFKGIAMGRTEYLYGCISIGVLPLKLKDNGSPGDWVWLDEQRLTLVSKAELGGPQVFNAPSKN